MITLLSPEVADGKAGDADALCDASGVFELSAPTSVDFTHAVPAKMETKISAAAIYLFKSYPACSFYINDNSLC
jgi:hypothetical protein